MARIRTIKPTRRAVTSEARREVARRYGAAPGVNVIATCAYCPVQGLIDWAAMYPKWPVFYLDLDHVIPLVEGGSNDADNLTLACTRCNLSKGGRMIAEVAS